MAYSNTFENWNGRIFIEKKSTSGSNVKVASDGLPIKVREEMQGDKKAYLVGYFPFSPPVVSLSATPSVLEVGASATVNFSGAVTIGSDGINTVTVSPTATDFSYVHPDVTFTAICGDTVTGLKDIHTVTATDNLNNQAVASAGVNVQHRYKIGTVARDTSTFVEQESKLGSSMSGAYGILTGYNIPTGQHHIAWMVPAGETMPTPTDANGFPWEVVDGGQQIITNAHGLNVTYNLVKTKNFYTGINTVNLKV